MSGPGNSSNDSISSSERPKDKNEPRKTGKADNKSTSEDKEAVADRKPPEWEQCLHAARWIPRAFDMYCTLHEVLRACRIIEQHEALDPDDEDDEESKAIKVAYDKLKSTLERSTIAHFQRVYKYLEEQAPFLFELIHKKERNKRTILVREMQSVINRTRSDDASHLRSAIGLYAAPLPDKKAVDPPVQPRGPKDKLGFNHPELAQLLCPVRHLQEMLEDPAGTKKKIESGVIKVTAQKHPAFLYEGDVPGKDFDPNNVAHGFLHRFLLERILKHIFTSPSSALSASKSRSTRASNGKIHKMTEVNASHIAYAAVHARFSICSQDKFVDVDGHFKFPDFYYRTVDFIENGADTTWVKELCAHYNKLLFDNARGVGHDVDNADEDSEDDVAIMKKQMAEQASKSSDSGSKSQAGSSASRAGSSESSTISQGSEGALDSVGTRATHENPLPNTTVWDIPADVDDPRSPSHAFSPWPVEPPGSPGPSTIAKGKRKQDAVPLPERSTSPLSDIPDSAEGTSKVNLKKRKKGKTSTAEKATGRKSTRSRK